MRKIVLVLLLILIISFSFAALKPIIRYSDNGVNSHACDPNAFNCAYPNSILVDESILADSITGVKIIGLSTDPNQLFAGTNSHSEFATNFGESVVSAHNNYNDYNIYLTPDAANSCNVTKGNSCGVRNCIFGMSDQTNAHLSQCNTFGSNELKLCCGFDSFVTFQPVDVDSDVCGISFFEVKNIIVDQNVNISYSCVTPIDINIQLFDSKGTPLLVPVFSDICGQTKRSFTNYKFTAEENLAVVKVETSECTKEKFFSVNRELQAMIPDNNIFVLLFVVLIVSIILVKKKD